MRWRARGDAAATAAAAAAARATRHPDTNNMPSKPQANLPDAAPGQFSRTERLIGADGLARLRASRVAVFGLGGVGSFAAEALVRSGVGAIDIIDNDTVAPSNLNRQLIALRSTLGRLKTDAMRERLLDINPACDIAAHPVFVDSASIDAFDFARYAYVIDAIDTVSAKLLLVERSHAARVPIISCMGAGNKLDPARFEVADISATQTCPLARVMRRELSRRGIKSLKVVYSKEPPLAPRAAESRDELEPVRDDLEDAAAAKGEEEVIRIRRRQTPGSIAFVPSVAGLIAAGEVVRSIAGGAD